MDLLGFWTLLSSQGQEAIRAAEALAPVEEDFLRNYTFLCKRFPPMLAKSALETAILRRAASDKFPEAQRMYFTRPALEQASGYETAIYRAKRMGGFDLLLDMACSIGSDTRAMAEVGPVIGIDLDPLRLAIARENLRVVPAAFPADFLQANLLKPVPVSIENTARTALFFDPSRRSNGQRFFSVNKYVPPLSVINNWLPYVPSAAVKISPGVDLAELISYDAELEFISIKGELKEAVLWFGELKTVKRRATILSSKRGVTVEDPYVRKDRETSNFLDGAAVDSSMGSASEPIFLIGDGQDEYNQIPIEEPQDYLLEPDPAVIRTGLVQELGNRIEASQIEPSIAYLTSRKKQITPFARIWKVESWFPFSLKRLREELRRKNIGSVVVKKRGSPIHPEQLIHDLRLQGKEQRVVFLTRHAGRAIAIICYPEILDLC